MMRKLLEGKVITVVGASGFVGLSLCRQASLYGATVNGVSRKGYPTGPQQQWYKDINWVRGDAMEAESFADVLKSSDLVIHTVGTLIDTTVTQRKKQGEKGTYEQMNRDTLINVAKQLEGVERATIVYISASRSPPFLQRYLTTKQEAEQYLIEKQAEGKLKFVIMRPGFIYSWQQRWWSVPLKVNVDIWRTVYRAADCLIPKQSFIGGIWQQLEVDSAVKLDDLVNASLQAALEPRLVGKILDNDKIAETSTHFIQQI